MHTDLIRIFIVDDEPHIRARLMRYNWDHLGAVIIGEAKNGEQALTCCRKLKPDLLLCDISMPVMSGLDLFDRLSRENLPTLCIFLTSFDDFHYVKRALELGALDYILKSDLEESSLHKLLQKARYALRKRNESNELLRIKHIYETGALLSEARNEKDVADILKRYDLLPPLPAKAYAIWAFAENEKLSIPYSPVLSSLLMHRTNDLRPLWWMPVMRMFLLLVPHEDDLMPFRTELRQNEFLEGNWQLVELNFVYNLQDILLIINNWESVGDKCFYTQDGSFNKLNETDYLTIARAIKQAKSNPETLEHVIAVDLPVWAEKSRPHPEELKKWCIQQVRNLYYTFGKETETASIVNIWQSSTLPRLIDSMIFEINRIFHNTQRNEILEAIRIIHTDCGAPLTLQSISEMVNLSPAYFSRLFHQQIGKNFQTYITEVRIQKASKLLLESNLKVYEVAAKVGFQNYRHFSALYKSITGFTPMDIRKGKMK